MAQGTRRRQTAPDRSAHDTAIRHVGRSVCCLACPIPSPPIALPCKNVLGVLYRQIPQTRYEISRREKEREGWKREQKERKSKERQSISNVTEEKEMGLKLDGRCFGRVVAATGTTTIKSPAKSETRRDHTRGVQRQNPEQKSTRGKKEGENKERSDRGSWRQERCQRMIRN